MPTTIITEAFKNTYRRNFMPLVQQDTSKLLKAVDVETGSEKVGGERHFIDQIGRREPQQVTTRHPDSPHTEQEYKRRAVTMKDWADGCIIDKPDIFRTLDDPTNPVVMEQRKGFARQIDRTIIAAATGTAMTGHEGTTPVPLPGTQSVPVDYDDANPGGGGAVSNLVVSKIRQALQILESNDADTDDLWFCAHPKQKQSLLTSTKVTSSDYAAVKALVMGEVDFFLSFRFIWSTLTSLGAGNVRTCFAWDRTALVAVFSQMPTVHLDPARSDKSFNPYAFVQMTNGSTRIEEERVVEVLCDEDVVGDVE